MSDIILMYLCTVYHLKCRYKPLCKKTEQVCVEKNLILNLVFKLRSKYWYAFYVILLWWDLTNRETEGGRREREYIMNRLYYTYMTLLDFSLLLLLLLLLLWHCNPYSLTLASRMISAHSLGSCTFLLHPLITALIRSA